MVCMENIAQQSALHSTVKHDAVVAHAIVF